MITRKSIFILIGLGMLNVLLAAVAQSSANAILAVVFAVWAAYRFTLYRRQRR